MNTSASLLTRLTTSSAAFHLFALKQMVIALPQFRHAHVLHPDSVQ
jgi:hypothetical protein